jgi:hypothetical protein
MLIYGERHLRSVRLCSVAADVLGGFPAVPDKSNETWCTLVGAGIIQTLVWG